MKEEQKRLSNMLQQPGCNNMLNVTTIDEYDYAINKKEFVDAIRPTYNVAITTLPVRCPCGEKFYNKHVMSCKNGDS